MVYVVEDIKNEDKGSPEFVKNQFYQPKDKKELLETALRERRKTYNIMTQID